MTMRVLVTGGAGLIGVGLVERLLAEGHRVVVLDNLFRGRMDHLNHVMGMEAFDFVEGDVTSEADLQRCAELLGGVDLVHHLAAINGTKWFHEAARQVIEVNINGTLVALSMAERWGARFVLASSPEAFGDPVAMPLQEVNASVFPSAEAHQRFSYGASKYLDEIAVQHAVRGGLDARIVRPFNAYGHRMVSDAYGQVIGMLFGAVQEQVPMTVHGDGSQTRSFTHLDDVVEGFYLAGALEVGQDGSRLAGSAFNIGSTEETTVLALAQAVNATVGSKAVDIVLGGGYHGDALRRVPACERALVQLGWVAKTSLEEGLRLMWARLHSTP
jgi:nucleoside-diphosphate-sugar epimerase